MMRFPEEAGVVGGDRIDQFAALGVALIGFEQSAILTEVRQAERAQTLAEPPLNEGALPLAENDSGCVHHQLCKLAEVPVVKRKIFLHHFPPPPRPASPAETRRHRSGGQNSFQSTSLPDAARRRGASCCSAPRPAEATTLGAAAGLAGAARRLATFSRLLPSERSTTGLP